MLSSVFSVLIIGLLFGFILFGCRGRERKVQARPRHGFGLLHCYFNLGSHHVHRAFTHVDYLQVKKGSWNSWEKLCWGLLWHQMNSSMIVSVTHSPQVDVLLKLLLSLKYHMNVELKDKRKHLLEKKAQKTPQSFKLIWRCIPHRGAVCIHVTQLWDGVFGIDGDDDLSPSLMPVEPTGSHFLTLQRYSTI